MGDSDCSSMRWNFGRKAWTDNVNLGVLSIRTVFKVLSLAEREWVPKSCSAEPRATPGLWELIEEREAGDRARGKWQGRERWGGAMFPRDPPSRVRSESRPLEGHALHGWRTGALSRRPVCELWIPEWVISIKCTEFPKLSTENFPTKYFQCSQNYFGKCWTVTLNEESRPRFKECWVKGLGPWVSRQHWGGKQTRPQWSPPAAKVTVY